MMFSRLWIIVVMILKCFRGIKAATHWVVTETGRIQANGDSPFDIRRPYDLLALLDQETRHKEINSLYNELVSRKSVIEKKWSKLEGSTDMDTKITTQDTNCLAAGKLFSDIDLYSNIVTNGSDREGVDIKFSNRNNDEVKSHKVPDCVRLSRLENSSAFNVPVDNNNILLSQEDSLLKMLPFASLKLFGHEIADQLSKNRTSWVHYNLAAIYWRIKGNGSNAIDCIKCAIHFVPHKFRDIPLHNLAGILHQARHSKEAALILSTAVDSAPKQELHYLALGNIYAALGDYNQSVSNYDKFLEIKPNQKDVIANKHATLCYWKLEKGLLHFQEALQGILTELHDYHSQQQQWLRLQERLMWEHSSFDIQLEGFHAENLNAFSNKKSQRCIQKMSENDVPIISCSSELDSLNLQNLFTYVENEKQKLNEQIIKTQKSNLQNGESNEINKSPPLLYPKFPTTMFTSNNQYFDSTGWPTKEDCQSWGLAINEMDDLNLPVYLPLENKGYQVKRILSDYIDLPDNSQHELPWYPPVCDHPNVFGEKYVPTNDRQALNVELKSSDFLRNQLLKYVNDGKADEAEIGQRIITATDKKSAPRWVLATLASLYWRVRGNTRKSLDCLDLAFQIVPKETTDVVLVSISSIIHELGFHKQALKFATLAFKINYVEPSTNFLLALLHYSNKNILLAMYYMKNVLRVDPDYYDGKAEVLLKTWGCRIKLGSYDTLKQQSSSETMEKAPDGICSKRESFKSEGVICSTNGEKCKAAAIQCFPTHLDDNAAVPSSKPFTPPCAGQQKVTLGLGQSLISSLLAAEGSGDTEPDQSRLEIMTDTPRHNFHIRLSIAADHHLFEDATLGDFYVTAAVNEDHETDTSLQVFDKYGTYSLSLGECSTANKGFVFKYSSVWPSIVSRSLDISPYLKPLPAPVNEQVVPKCKYLSKSPTTSVDRLTSLILGTSSTPEKELLELLGLMSGDQKASIKELGAKLGLALKDNTTSWILATASAIYWRIIGNSEEIVACLRLAFSHVPKNMQDIPLMNLAGALNKVGFHNEALDVAYRALEIDNKPVLHHYTVANIHASMGEFEKAIAFYRICLAIDRNFEPARRKIRSMLCNLLFKENGTVKEYKGLND